MINPPSGNDLVKMPNGMMADRGCKLCRLNETCKTVCITGTGSIKSKAMIIGEAPGANEDNGGEPFVGRAGALLDELMAEAGLSREDVYITNAVHCRPVENRTPTKSEIRKCQPWVFHEIERVDPEVVLLLGNVPLQSVLGLTGIKKLRGNPIEHTDGRHYLPAFHPAYVLREERVRGQLLSDLKKFKAMIEGGGIPELPGVDYTIVRSRIDVEDMLEFLERQYAFAFDLETDGLSPRHGRPVSIGVGTDKKQFIMLTGHRLEQLPSKIIEYAVEEITKLKSVKKYSWNGKYDSGWMLEHYGVEWLSDVDGMLQHYILNENSMHGLDVVANEKYGALNWDVPLSIKTGKTGTVEEHCRYLAGDIMHTFKLCTDQTDELDDNPGVQRVFEDLLMPAARMFVGIENRGVYIDTTKFDEAETFLRDTIAQADFKLNDACPGVNWGSPKQVADVLFTQLGLTPLDITKGGSPSTSESVLKRLQDEHPIPGLLLKRRAAAQQLSFFIEGWKPWLVNNRLHPSFKLHGTVTGRLSCSDPNLQQVPRDPRIRQLITAPPGWVLVEADLSQIELRIAAELSGDNGLLDCFNQDIDVHWRTMWATMGTGDAYADKIIRTASMYCVQQGLPANGSSCEILSTVWRKKPSTTKSNSVIQLLRAIRENPKPWCGERGSAREYGNASQLERRNDATDASEIFPTEFVRALRVYAEFGPTPRGQEPKKLGTIELENAVSLLSSLPPSEAEQFDKGWKELRKKAKAVNFGFLFGMWWKKFKDYARDNYDTIVTDEEAQQMRVTFFDLYQKLPKWHRKQKDFANRNGYVRSLMGRKRRLPAAKSGDDTFAKQEAERQAINSPVQSFASDLNLAAGIELTRRHSPKYFRIVGAVHDALLMEVRKDKVKMVVDDVLRTMSHPEMLDHLGIELRVPIEAEVKIGPWSLGVSPEKYYVANGL